MKTTLLRITASLLALTAGTAIAVAQETNQAYGTAAAPNVDRSTFNQHAFHSVANTLSAQPLAALPPAPILWTGASYATGGVALRNRGSGTISISGFVGPVKATYIYWAVIEPNAASGSIHVRRLSPTTTAKTKLVGTVVGVGPQPCWTGSMITVYRASIPSDIANDNGSYEITIPENATGSTDGGDPWVETPVLPLWEGASMVMVGPGKQTVNIFDVGLAGMTFIPPYSYTLNLVGAISGGGTILWDSIAADGQAGISRNANAELSGETTTINGLVISGQGSGLNLDSDFNGSSGLPLPQLWDDTGHQFTISPTVTLDITIGPSSGQFDCITPVANVVQF